MDGTGPSTAELIALRDRLASRSPASTDGQRVDRLRVLEEIKAAAAAAQAAEAAAFDRSQRAEAAVAGVASARQGRGVAAQIALALRVSPWQGRRWLGWAKILTTELPATFAELAAGRTTEWRAILVARETAVLSRADRSLVDRELAPRLQGWGDRQVEAEARRAAYRLDPHAAVARSRQAEADRRVSIRPAPDTMCRLSALLPVAQGVASYAALTRAADTCTAGGDPRGRGQVMADTLVERLTGQAAAAAVPAEIVLVMSDRVLLDGEATEPAHLTGYGPLPAPIARRFALDGSGQRWLRRLYTDQSRPVALDSTRRRFTTGQRLFLALRDQTCRTPWCGAPVRHADHVHAYVDGGPTSVLNGQSLCQACNHAKQAPGWAARAAPDGTITTRTPTGHRYSGRPPDLVRCGLPVSRWHIRPPAA